MTTKKDFELEPLPEIAAVPLPAKIRSSFQQLTVAASSLNTASDRLSKVVAKIDEALKPLNIGLESWVNMGGPWVSADGYEEYGELVGYAKIGGKWGVALRTFEEDVRSGEYVSDEKWLFNEGPRKLRLKALDYIPDLLAQLATEAAKFTAQISNKTKEAEQLVQALKGSASQ